MTLSRSVPLVLLFGACTGDADSDLSATCSIAASGGADQAVLLSEPVELVASHTVLDDCPTGEISYRWSFEELPADSTLDDLAFGAQNDTSATLTTFTPDALGTYVVSLVAHDSISESALDLVILTVTTDNPAPIADAGTADTAPIGIRYTFDGSNSSDPEAEVLTFDWDIASLPEESSITLFDEHTANASFVPDLPGTYVFSLRVSDGTSWSAVDYVALVAEEPNGIPIADAGNDQVLSACESADARLNGWASYDPDADPLFWDWEVLDTPGGSDVDSASLDSASDPNPRFYWDIAGEYSFSLQVSDGAAISPYDLVYLTTTELEDNHAPIANAGTDTVITLSADCENTGEGVVCESCRSINLDLDAELSTDADADALTTSWVTTGEAEIVQPTAPWTEIVTPTIAATSGVTVEEVFEVGLTVADCVDSDVDTRLITIRCTGSTP